MSGSTPHWSQTVTLDATPISAHNARAFVSGQLAAHLLVHLADSMQLVVSELATNALVHAHTPFSVTLVGDDHLVVLTVRDDSTSLPARRTAQATDAGGRGLQLVDTLSTHWGVNTDAAGSKAVWASFAIT